MATITGLTAERMLAIEAAAIVGGSIVGDNLILERYDSTTIDAGVVVGDTGPEGPEGPAGADGVSVPSGGSAGDVLVKASGTDYDFIWGAALRAIGLNPQTASYTLGDGDEEAFVIIENAAATIVTVPADATHDFDLGTRIRILQGDTGTVSIAGAVGVTLIYPSWQVPSLGGLGATVELIKVGDNLWVLDGHGNLATTELGWQTYTPNIVATTSGPNLGTAPVKKGYYIQDSLKRVIGGATVRPDTAGSPSRGSGTYRLTLPVEGVNYEDLGYSPIGNCSIGIGSVHTEAMLHFNGVTGVTTSAVAAIQDALFLTHSTPAGTLGNVHWHFSYQAL